MSPKVHLLHSHLGYLGDVNKQHGEQFHHDIKEMENSTLIGRLSMSAAKKE